MDIDFVTAICFFLGGVGVAVVLALVQRFFYPETILKAEQADVEAEEEES